MSDKRYPPEILLQPQNWISIKVAALVMNVSMPTFRENLEYYIQQGVIVRKNTPKRIEIFWPSIYNYLKANTTGTEDWPDAPFSVDDLLRLFQITDREDSP